MAARIAESGGFVTATGGTAGMRRGDRLRGLAGLLAFA